MTLTRKASDVLREAIEDEIVDTIISPFDGRSIPFKMFQWVVSQQAIDPQNPHTYDLLTHPKSRRYQQSILPPAIHETTTDYWAVELSRIVVPKGQIGFLTSIEQVLNAVSYTHLTLPTIYSV